LHFQIVGRLLPSQPKAVLGIGSLKQLLEQLLISNSPSFTLHFDVDATILVITNTADVPLCAPTQFLLHAIDEASKRHGSDKWTGSIKNFAPFQFSPV
jgi:hypothetical protein